jgi:hypothetical protein
MDNEFVTTKKDLIQLAVSWTAITGIFVTAFLNMAAV